jgi:hypothetical protein
MILFHDTDRPTPLFEHEGLTHYLSTTIRQPETLDRAGYEALSDTARRAYDRERVLFLSGGILVNTPDVSAAKNRLRRLMGENLGRNSGHVGLMLSGDSTLGKTTIAKTLMTYVYRNYQQQFPDFAARGRVPVVYIEVPAGSTGKLLMIAFARFFGLTVLRAETADSIKMRVVAALNAAGTQLVVVDELHNLSATNRGNGESVDILKSLHNQVPATFVYAGIHLDSGALLAGSRGQQLSARFIRTDLSRFNRSDPVQERDWKAIVSKFEKSLPLFDHVPGTLVKLSRHLHDRTNGSIGSLGKLITGAAIDLILDPAGRPEAITTTILDDQILDIAAETSYANRPTSTNRPTSAKTRESEK